MTRTRDEQTGTLFEIEGGERVTLEEAGCPSGTTITVRDIFFNTPARMKFLKKDVTEGNAVASVVERIALSHPEISIKFIRDGKKIFSTPGDNSLFSAIYTVLGKQFANVLIEAGYDYNGITVRGYVCKPQNSRPNRNMQFFFINGRLVKSGTCSAAVSEGYRNLVMTGKFPACVLNISIPEELVDVNVHPAKTEVRFENERDVFNAVYFACKSAVDTHDTTDAYSFKSGDGEAAGSENAQPERRIRQSSAAL